MRDPLMTLARRAGIVGSYTDQTGRMRRTGRATAAALLRALGLPSDAAGARDWLEHAAARCGDHLPDWAICEPGSAPRLGLGPEQDWTLTQEDGTQHEGRGADLPALPLGLHSLQMGGARVTIIAAPRRLPLPRRDWGMMVPLYALRTAERGGIGDTRDLQEAGTALARHGAGFMGLNPIHAGFPADPGQFSPYTPSHRRRLSALYVHAGAQAEPDAGAARIDYTRAIPARMAALRAEYNAFAARGGDPDFDAYRSAQGAALERFATHQALSDRLGAYWPDWPAELHDPDGPAVARAAAELSDDIAFHAWAQWQAERQLGQVNAALQDAGMGHGLYLDLAVGTHPGGAETWEDRDSFARGASLGAPPDAFAANGQDWGLAPFNPRALIAGGFAALAETLRAQLRFSGALRIDHILGFDRAFWVPQNGAPGSYVKMPRDAMLAVIRLEAARAGALIVGEDLGNIPRGLRSALQASGILGCRVMMFERGAQGFRPPARYAAAAMASFSTHDLPTWAGWRKGADIAAHERLGHVSGPEATALQTARAGDVAAMDAMTAPLRGDAPPDSADAMHRALAASGSTLVQAQVECALDVVDQPNLPGTIDSYPNWRQRLPVAAGDLAADPRIARAAGIMQAAGRGRRR